MAGNPGGAGPVGDRSLIEEAVTLLLAQAPTGWTQLHAECEPACQPVVATAAVTTPDGLKSR